jgi:TonB family protein
MNKTRRSGKTVKTSFYLILALATVGFCQDDVKKLTRAEALTSVQAKVEPEYPPMAKQLKIAGSVEIEAVITESGTVEKVNIVKGNPMLTKAAADAVIKWKFKPITADGKPVKALAPIEFIFK